MKHTNWVDEDFDAEIKIGKDQAYNLVMTLNRFLNKQ